MKQLHYSLLLAWFAAMAISPGYAQKKQTKNRKTTMNSRPTLVYVFDPLCGWCYGFSPSMKKLETQWKDRLDFQVVSGGMVLGERIGPLGEVAPYIKSAYKDVENATGVKFGEAFVKGTLEKGTAIFSSQLISQALAVVNQDAPNRAVEAAHALQSLVYFEGKEPEVVASYDGFALQFGYTVEDFRTKLKSDAIVKATQEGFYLSRRLGVRGFPTVFLKKDGKHITIANGCVPYSTLESNLQKSLAQ